MTRFEVNGEYLDLPADFSLQFKKKNILFSFDNIECERSTSFDIPATPKNNRIFSLAKWVQSEGVGMRRKYEAQMQSGIFVQNGYLHIDQYSEGKYSAVFVTGELLGLKKLRDAGKIKEYYTPAGGIVWGTENIKDANTAAGQYSLAITKYLTNVSLPHPSFDLSDIMNGAYNTLTGHNLPQRTRGYRLIPKEVQGMPKTECQITFTGLNATEQEDPSDAELANTLAITGAFSAVGQVDAVLRMRHNTIQYMIVRQFVAKQRLVLTFPSDLPANYCLMSIDPDTSEYNALSQDWFLGSRSFYQATGGGITYVGAPLAGSSVTVESGQPFILVYGDWYKYEPAPFNINGFLGLTFDDYQISVQIENDSLEEGDTVRAYDMLPDLTLVELLKIYTYLEGKVLNYTEADGVLFDTLDVENWANYDLTGKVINESAISRTFGDYAQRNTLQFESGSEVLLNQRIKTFYTIDNDNLQEEKELGTIPYSEGQLAERDGFIVARLDAEDTDKNVLYADGIMIASGTTSTAPSYGARASLPKNSGIQSLCDASTSVTIRAYISYLEYEQITPKTAIYFNGVRYVWTESNWSKGIATFKLSKISA